MPSKTLILGSTSPFRRELLERLAIPFETDSPEVDESRLGGETPELLVRRLAESKARAVGLRHPDALVIGSDQVAVLEGEVMGKPGSPERAAEQLRRASGRTVTFLTGLCLLNTATDRAQVDVIPFEVTFRELDDGRIRRYLAHDRPWNCAGSFKSEGLGIALFRRMSGEDPTALIGLPLIRLVEMLAAEGIVIP
ncbi:MAG TPA: septum formation inhibitor Maf [Thiotrichales bacterium]|nr:septum formation inhibitor Maf [Thiotrichales bacterium]